MCKRRAIPSSFSSSSSRPWAAFALCLIRNATKDSLADHSVRWVVAHPGIQQHHAEENRPAFGALHCRLREIAIFASVIRSLVGVTAWMRQKRDAKQASERHCEQHKSRPVKAKLEPCGQLPTLCMNEEYIDAGKLKPDTGRHGCYDEHDTNEPECSRLHACSVAKHAPTLSRCAP
jgi:hypothetical protein